MEIRVQKGMLVFIAKVKSSTGVDGRLYSAHEAQLPLSRWTEVTAHFSVQHGWKVYFNRAHMAKVGYTTDSLEEYADDGVLFAYRSGVATFDAGKVLAGKSKCSSISDVMEISNLRFLTKQEWDDNEVVLSTYSSSEQSSEVLGTS